MIRINLLPVRGQKKRETGIQQIILFAALLVIESLVVVGWFMVNDNELNAIKEEISKDEAEVTRLEKIIGEVNQYEDQKKKLQAQLSVIEELEKGKSGPVKVLDALATAIPKRVWIDGFDEKAGVATVTGFGLEMADISEFLKTLEKNNHFGDVQLKWTENVPQKGISTFRFQLTCKVNYNI